jgi:hypothetical protein
MTDDRITDGRRITELLASEVTARSDGPLSGLELVDVQSDAEGSEDGTFAYGIAVDEVDTETQIRLADVYVHDERAFLEFRTGLDPIPATAKEANLRVRPKAVEPPRVLVFVEDGGAVKRALDVIRVAVGAVQE